jgi:hypothetical protein
MQPATLNILNWNVEWRRPTSSAGRTLLSRISECQPDIICLTESYTDFIPSSGHLIEAAIDYGYPIVEGRRKFLLWSRQPWTAVDAVGHPDLPSGRFVRGTTSTPIGLIDVTGICIPWSGAHVVNGRRDRRRWEDHLALLGALSDIIPLRSSRRLIVGDFNQRCRALWLPARPIPL